MSIEIVGMREYQEFAQTLLDPNRISQLESRYFHTQFMRLLSKRIEDRKNGDHFGIEWIPYLFGHDRYPQNQGIYFCSRDISTESEIWYIGKAGNFRARWRNHHKYHALKAIQDVYITFLFLDGYSQKEISIAEQMYIDMLKPAFNNTSKPEKHLRLAS